MASCYRMEMYSVDVVCLCVCVCVCLSVGHNNETHRNGLTDRGAALDRAGPKEPALDGCPDLPWRKAVLGSFPAIESIAIVKCAITSAYAY